MALDLGLQLKMLEEACHRLLLRPDEVAVREDLARTIAAIELSAAPDGDVFVRALVDEVRAHADSLAFRLEGRGYDCLYISGATTVLCQAMTQLKLQLSAVASRSRPSPG